MLEIMYTKMLFFLTLSKILMQSRKIKHVAQPKADNDVATK